ncbi:unnamed protein product [Staurois parvus]|uniref:Uncharacterized protein n=1 Tax=Staurois parvus TaxID=386267 RepID=A0ABN9EGS1_9NEOB|nr:unnamed protein product [Staurois parvus]
MLGETNPVDSKPDTIRGASAYRLEGTSVTAVTPWKVPRQRLPCGSKTMNWLSTAAVPNIGCTRTELSSAGLPVVR